MKILFLLTFLPTLLFAGNKEGHGGHGLICFPNNSQVWQNKAVLNRALEDKDLLLLENTLKRSYGLALFDFWEADPNIFSSFGVIRFERFDWERDSGLEEFKRLPLTPLRRQTLRVYSQLKKRIVLRGLSSNSSDLGPHKILPKNCQLVQLAKFLADGTLVLNVMLYPYLEQSQRMGLIFHETLQTGTHLFKMQNTFEVRRMTRELALPILRGEISKLDLHLPLHRKLASYYGTLTQKFHPNLSKWTKVSSKVLNRELTDILQADPWQGFDDMSVLEGIYVGGINKFAPEVQSMLNENLKLYQKTIDALKTSSFPPPYKRFEELYLGHAILEKRNKILSAIIRSTLYPQKMAELLDRDSRYYISRSLSEPRPQFKNYLTYHGLFLRDVSRAIEKRNLRSDGLNLQQLRKFMQSSNELRRRMRDFYRSPL